MENGAMLTRTVAGKDEFAENGDDGALSRQRPIINAEHFDVEGYAALYQGHTKINRLLFIAKECGVPEMELEALRIAYDGIKNGVDTVLFHEVVQKIDGRLGEAYGPDDAWVDAVDRRAELRMAKLETDLNFYKTSMIRESIRMGYSDLADFYYARGNLVDALRNYLRTRDYASTSKMIVGTYLTAIRLSIEMDQLASVRNYVMKILHSPEAMDPVTMGKILCATGLALLESRDYKLAAYKFLETDFELGNKYNEVITPQDVATYGGLCALATFDRAEMKSKVIENGNFRNFLELAPEMRELLNDFHNSRYASCFEYLERLKGNLLLDIHLHEHVEALYGQIRYKALIQYTIPYVSIDLRLMANAFRMALTDLEKELADLIMNNQIQARIDSHNKILYAQHTDQRSSTFQRVLQTGEEYDQDVRSMLLRASLIQRGVYHKDSWRR